MKDYITKKWTYNVPNAYIWANELFETREEAEEAAVKYAKETKNVTMHIGMCELIQLPKQVDVEHIFGYLNECYLDECDGAYDDYLYENVSVETVRWLETEIVKLIDKLHQKEGIESQCFKMVNTYCIDIEGIKKNEPRKSN